MHTERLQRHACREARVETISHAIRTPLNVIIGYTDMQLDGAFGDLDAEHASMLRTVREQAVRLLALIPTTLDPERLDRGLDPRC